MAASLALVLGGTAAHADAAAPVAPAEPRSADAFTARDHGHRERRALPRVATSWAAAWNAGDGQAMASLFTDDGVYTDHAFGASFAGPHGVHEWVTITGQSIADVRVDIRRAYRSGSTVVVSWTFSGHIIGAPSAFVVPARTVIRLEGRKIRSADDYYDLAEVKRQSGLPADSASPPDAP